MKLLTNPNEFKKISESLNAKKLSVVRFTPNQKIRFMIVPYANTDTPFIVTQEVHEILNEKYGYKVTVPCVKGFYKYQTDSLGNPLTDETGNLILARDPITKRILNDGSCPYCEVASMENQLIYKKIAEYDRVNPTAPQETRKEFIKTIFNKSYISNKIRLIAGVVVAVLKTDETGEEPVYDEQGRIQFKIAIIKFKQAQYEDKFLVALNDAGQTLNQEFILNLPNKVDKNGNPDAKAAALAMTITPRFKNLFTEKDPTLWERIKAEASKITLENIEDEISSFKKETVIEIESKLAGRKSVLSAQLSEGEKLALAQDLAQPLANVGDYVQLNPSEQEVGKEIEASYEDVLGEFDDFSEL